MKIYIMSAEWFLLMFHYLLHETIIHRLIVPNNTSSHKYQLYSKHWPFQSKLRTKQTSIKRFQSWLICFSTSCSLNIWWMFRNSHSSNNSFFLSINTLHQYVINKTWSQVIWSMNRPHYYVEGSSNWLITAIFLSVIHCV